MAGNIYYSCFKIVRRLTVSACKIMQPALSCGTTACRKRCIHNKKSKATADNTGIDTLKIATIHAIKGWVSDWYQREATVLLNESDLAVCDSSVKVAIIRLEIGNDRANNRIGPRL